jgi:hypothetical protein
MYKLCEYTIPSFLFSKQARIVRHGERGCGIDEYVAALLYDPDTQSFPLHEEPGQPYQTFYGGQVEPTDTGLFQALAREMHEEAGAYAPHIRVATEPDLSISHPGLDEVPPQLIHIFLGMIDRCPDAAPMIPGWLFREITEYMANLDIASSILELISRFGPIEGPCNFGSQQNTTVMFPQYPLARIRTTSEYTD